VFLFPSTEEYQFGSYKWQEISVFFKGSKLAEGPFSLLLPAVLSIGIKQLWHEVTTHLHKLQG
jgi:hypothetical protein